MNKTLAPAWLRWPAEAVSIVAVIGLGVLLGRLDLPRPVAENSGLEPPAFDGCGPGAYLRGQLHGDLEWTIDWSAEAMRCDGMLRPDAAGLRLIFAPPEQAKGPLLVIGLNADPDDALGREVVANITIVDEGNGRFFNSGTGERCWAQASRVISDADGYQVAGRVYCAGALAQVNGTGTVTPGELEFAGRITAFAE